MFRFSVQSCTLTLIVICLPFSLLAQSQTSQTSLSNTSAGAVPAMIKFSGAVAGASGRMLGMTFALYKDQEGGAPLWLENQSVSVDGSGHYTVQLGATLPNGLPRELFVSGEARWLGVQREGQAEQPRVLLLSVPYALKAADAETLGGLPASAFLLAPPATAAPTANSAPAISPASTPPPNAAVTGLGSVNTVPLWDSTSDIVSSAISQTGTGATAKIGINTTAPTVTLDVKGASTIRGALTLPTTGTATATAGKNSQPLNLSGSAFNSGTGTAVNQTFRLQTEPVSNDTAATSGKLNLLYYSGANAAIETGLSIASNGQITFAPGQAFPGTGAGTITGVTAGTALTGGGTTGAITLNVDTTKLPLLNRANTFTGNQTVNGNLTATGTVTGSSFQIGSTLFAFGSIANSNSFLGFSGNLTTTGTENAASGAGALSSNTTGSFNTASGGNALVANASGNNNTADGEAALESNLTGNSNTADGAGALISSTTASNNTASGAVALGGTTTGGGNTAAGAFALQNNTAGSNNTAIGLQAGPDSSHPNLSNATAIGANALVTASNSLVLGASGVNVGIGTSAPAFTLDVHGNGNFTGPITFAAGQTFPDTGTITGVAAGTALTGGGTSGVVTLNVDTTKVVTGVVAGTALTGGGTGGTPTLNLDTTKVPLLTLSNTFLADQIMNGNLTVAGKVNTNVYEIQGAFFGYGDVSGGNAFLGFSGNSTSTGTGNTATGYAALGANTSGFDNLADGGDALFSNSTGAYNTASGFQALFNNTTGTFNTAAGLQALAFNLTGSSNTAVGYLAGPDATHTNLSNSTAIGANAEVTASNAMVLGSINGVNSATANTNVGIGITAPAFRLHIGIGGNGFRVEGPATTGTGLPAGSFGGNGDFGIDAPGIVQGRFVVKESGFVGVGVAAPTHIFQVGQGKGAAFADGWLTYSSRRWKTNIQTLPDALAKVEQLRGVTYDLKGSGKHEIGVIAEEVGQVVPEVVSFEANGKDVQGVDYSRLTAVLIEAMKEQQRQIQEQSRQIRSQQRQIARLNGKVGMLESGLLRKAGAERKKLQPTRKSVSVAGAPPN